MSVSNSNSEFSRLQDICYLDHAGTALYSDSQIDSICEYLKTNLLGNPHSLNLSSQYCYDAIGQLRDRILKHFNTNEDEYSLVFTSGTTSGLRTVVESFNWGNIEKGCGKGQFVYLRDVHTSVLGLREIAADKGVRIKCLEHEDAFVRFRNVSSRSETNESFGDVGNSLFVFPAMCNFSGCKYPLDWIEKLRTTRVLDHFLTDTVNDVDRDDPSSYRWFSLLDASSFVPTNNLDLNAIHPDFVAFSFYKMFGYPTGLGGLLIRKSSEFVLKKSYYGGGTILMALSDERLHIRRPTCHEWYEDGTINFLSILSTRQGFETLQRFGGTMESISEKVFRLTAHLHEKLTKLHHSNGQKVVNVYRDTDYSDPHTQGGIINFNLMRPDGSYVGYMEVMHLANSYGIHLRTGCFCNPGACQRHLKLTNAQLLNNYSKGHTCADHIELIDGHPTGSVRVSFGYASNESDVDTFMKMIVECFVAQPVIWKIPDHWSEESRTLKRKFCGDNFIVKNSAAATTRGPSSERRARIKNIHVYPVKSCGAFSVRKSWPLTKTGLQYDREWMIVSEDGVVLTQKQLPRLCLIIPNIDTERGILSLGFLNTEDDFDSSVEVPLEYESSTSTTFSIHQSRVCRDKVEVVDCGDHVSNWLTLKLNKPNIRLVKLVARNRSECSSPSDLSLANQAQFLLITEQSVRWLQERMSQNFKLSAEDVSKRFRSNFVIDGVFEALEEFEWNCILVGSCQFQVEGPCTRCQMICINQSSGERNKEPITALSAALRGRIQFGIYLRRDSNETVSVLNIDDEVVPFRKSETCKSAFI